MSVSWNATAQTNRMTQGLNQIDNNASPAKLEIGTAAMASTIVTLTFAKPSFTVGGTPPNCKLTMSGASISGTASLAGTNTAAAARIRDGGNADVVTGLTVGTSGSDINLNSTSITNGQTVTITAFTITHSP